MTEIELHDRSQMPLLLEHVDKGRPDPFQAALLRLTGVPIYFNEAVPKGTLRVRKDDGTTHDFTMA